MMEEIIAHSREGKPDEICGILRGRGPEAFELVRGVNVAEDKVNNYDLDPQTLLRQFAFEETGDEMMGIYHSHPISVAYPSATDAWSAHYPDSVYLICSLEYDDAPVLRAFRLITHYLELDLPALRDGLPFYETRRHLFAYFQAADASLPPVLRSVTEGIAAPFYVLFYDDGEGGEIDSRVVTVGEVQVVAR